MGKCAVDKGIGITARHEFVKKLYDCACAQHVRLMSIDLNLYYKTILNHAIGVAYRFIRDSHDIYQGHLVHGFSPQSI